MIRIPSWLGCFVATAAIGCGGGAPLPGGWAGPDRPASAPAPDREKEIRAKLGKPISFDFPNMPLRDCLGFFQDLAGVTIVLDASAGPAAERKITLKADGMKTSNALNWVLRQGGLRAEVWGEGLLVTGGEAVKPPAFYLSLEGAPDGIRKKLEKPVSFVFQDVPLNEVLDFFRQFTEVPISLDESAAKAGESKVSLKMDGMGMKISNALAWFFRQVGVRGEWRDGALRVMSPGK